MAPALLKEPADRAGAAEPELAAKLARLRRSCPKPPSSPSPAPDWPVHGGKSGELQLCGCVPEQRPQQRRSPAALADRAQQVPQPFPVIVIVIVVSFGFLAYNVAVDSQRHLVTADGNFPPQLVVLFPAECHDEAPSPVHSCTLEAEPE